MRNCVRACSRRHDVMTHRPFRLGLTGSIGMGKSTVAAMFARLGVPVFDADAQVHALQGPDGALLGAIEARFSGTTGPRGVDRQALGARVIGHRAEMAALEAIVHPAVAQCRRDFLRRHRAHRVVLLDIPLLFETGSARDMDMVILVSASAFVQHRRVLARPGMTRRRLAQIKASQLPDRVKRARADLIIETARPKWHTYREIAQLVACLRAR